MEVPTIQMARQKALDKLGSYRSQLQKRADSEYEAAVAGYKALADGKVLLDLEEVFAECPRDEKQRPMLAIGRADRRQVALSWDGPGRYRFDARSNEWAAQPGPTNLVMMVGSGLVRDNAKPYGSGYALIPLVPADARPNVDLKKCHVLWEVPEWADGRISAAPVDPYLLQHLAGSLWVVLAEWELTPLEQAITRGRIDS